MTLDFSKKNNIYFSIFFIFTISLYYYFLFSAEDSYIVARYASNFVHHDALAYNPSEPISALTSPLHAITESILHLIIPYDPVIIWKCFSVILLILSVYHLSKLLETSHQKILFHISVLLSSPILLWTVGGLETILLLFLISLLIYFYIEKNLRDTNTLIIIGFISGLAFLTRFDTSIFLLPITLYIIWQNKSSKKNILIFILIPIIIISAWILFSFKYYGHIMPTSFFKKPPSLSVSHIIATIRGFFWIGAIPIMTYILFSKDKLSLTPRYNIVWLAYITLTLYMFTMANKHMMFGFRAFIPYLPVFFILTLLMKKEFSKLIIILFTLFQISQIYANYTYGINFPISEHVERLLFSDKFKKTTKSEYALLNIPNYISFMNTLKKQGELIIQDWGSTNNTRKPIVYTYAEGIASYSALDAYFIGLLVTRSSCKQPDYVMNLKGLDNKIKLVSKNYKGNPFTLTKLNFYIFSNARLFEFNVSRYKDLDSQDKIIITDLISWCNKQKIW